MIKWVQMQRAKIESFRLLNVPCSHFSSDRKAPIWLCTAVLVCGTQLVVMSLAKAACVVHAFAKHQLVHLQTTHLNTFNTILHIKMSHILSLSPD